MLQQLGLGCYYFNLTLRPSVSLDSVLCQTLLDIPLLVLLKNLSVPILHEDAQNIKRTAKYAKSAKNRELLI
ncbi:MAG: hypothetical protein V7K35_27275 [Nostoc sp.]